MKKSIVMAVTSILSISLMACQADRPVATQASSVPEPSAKDTQPKVTNTKALRTDKFVLLLPAGWTVKEGLDSYTFETPTGTVGGVDILLKGSQGEELTGLIPNHSRILSQKEMTGAPLKTIIVELEQSQTAASSSIETRHMILYYLFSDKDNKVYDIYFNLSKISKEETLRIVKTFKER